MKADLWLAMSIMGGFFFVLFALWADLTFWRHCRRKVSDEYTGRGIPSGTPDL